LRQPLLHETVKRGFVPKRNLILGHHLFSSARNGAK
jgi:hypothetical protein